jgi:hypothetical protein
MRSPPWLVAVVVLLSLGCGSATSAGKAMHPSSPFTDNDARLFENGVDLVGDPAALTGRWADDWASELSSRVQRSDLIALLTVNTLRTDVNPQERTTHWLVGNIGDVLKGASADELSLATADDALGFDSVDRERMNILRRPMLVLAKWVKDSNGTVRARWHLATASPQVVAAVRNQLKRGDGDATDVSAPR